MVESITQDPSGQAPVAQFDGVSRVFGTAVALHDVSFSVAEGEFFSIIGPSGSGKTTTIRMIAGLETPTSGTVRLFGKDVTSVPPHKRETPMVFQSYALFPHLSVIDNVAYGLRMRGVSKVERRDRAERLLDLVGLQGLGERRPDQLSGGQQQRVALARALAAEPRVVLLDEALGALDAALRVEMQSELKRLQDELGCSFIHVTHDQSEAIAMADRVLVLHNGRLEQVGTPTEVFARPKTRFVANFVGQNNLLDGSVVDRVGENVFSIETAIGQIEVEVPTAKKLEAGQSVTVVVRADALRRVAHHDTPNEFTAAVVGAQYSGARVTLLMEAVNGTEFRMEEHESLSAGNPVRPGDEVLVGWDLGDAYVMD